MRSWGRGALLALAVALGCMSTGVGVGESSAAKAKPVRAIKGGAAKGATAKRSGAARSTKAGAARARAKSKGRLHARTKPHRRRVVVAPASEAPAAPTPLTPVEVELDDAPEERDAFDRFAAARALRDVDVDRCKIARGPTGNGHIVVRFEPSGHVSRASIDQGPFSGGKAGVVVGACIERAFARIQVPPFRGAPLDVGKTFFVR